MPKRVILFLAVISSLCWSQAPSSDGSYLVRIERQTRDESVCILLQRDGHYHLERLVVGHPRVFEGTLLSSAVSELEPLLNTDQLVNLKQGQVETTLVGEDLDQVLIAVSRIAGWQSISFPTGKSRMPFKAQIDPILKWLDRNKQQQNPIVGATVNRCMPSQTASARQEQPNRGNPYVMRIVIDHYEPLGLQSPVINASDASSSTPVKVTRLCTIVYENGRYRLEKSIQEFGSSVRSGIYRDTVDTTQLDELKKILDNPKLSSLPNSAAPAVFAGEGELISLAVPRAERVQALSFASFFGAHTAEARMKGNTSQAISSNVELTHAIRKWIKQNLENRKTPRLTDSPSTVCIPSTQPE